jgi:hypothetical protein
MIADQGNNVSQSLSYGDVAMMFLLVTTLNVSNSRLITSSSFQGIYSVAWTVIEPSHLYNKTADLFYYLPKATSLPISR